MLKKFVDIYPFHLKLLIFRYRFLRVRNQVAKNPRSSGGMGVISSMGLSFIYDYHHKMIHASLKMYFGAIFILTALGSWQAFLTHNTWHLGDWLINYQGGFVRRGLLGELIYQLSVYSSVSPGFYVFVCQIFFNAAFFFFSFLLLKKQKSLAPFVLLVVSPFVFAFPINSFDHIASQGGYFKDCIYYCVLAFLAWSAMTQPVRTFEKNYYLILLSYPLLILSHEAFAVFLPYIIILYLTKVEPDRKRVLLHLSLLSLSIISFVFCIIYKGNEDQVMMIYHSLLEKYPVTVQGSIGWLGLSMQSGLSHVLFQIQYNDYLKNYSIALLLSLIAFFPVSQQLKFIFKKRMVCFLSLFALIGTISLCCVAIDWGRFIRFNLISMFLLSLLAGTLMVQGNDELKLKKWIKVSGMRYVFYFGVLLFSLSYALLWRIPSCCNYRPILSGVTTNNLSWSYRPYKKIIYDIVQWINTV